MLIKEINLKNIGPFKNAKVEFANSNNDDKSNITILTGENGTGKSILLDAIRSMMMGAFDSVERLIYNSENFSINLKIELNDKKIDLQTNSLNNNSHFDVNDFQVNTLFRENMKSTYRRDFIFDYWTTKLSNDQFKLNNIETLRTDNYLNNSLSGIHKNIDVTRTIAFFDYLKDSKNKDEREMGRFLYKLLETVINNSLTNGKFLHVSRINLTPLVKIYDNEISLDKLSSGNLYLITRMISLIRQIYSICTINKIPVKDYKKITGVLLIDEAENHLHPKWQKTFLQNILALFPNIQIILTTHSPFIISSVGEARVYVCKNREFASEIFEETDFYSNSPIEEILKSPLFDTNTFNFEISQLIEKRKYLLENNEIKQANQIEKKLLKINPEYFNYIIIENSLKKLK